MLSKREKREVNMRRGERGEKPKSRSNGRLRERTRARNATTSAQKGGEPEKKAEETARKIGHLSM